MRIDNEALLLSAADALSLRDWIRVDRATLPDVCFLDPANRRFPVREANEASHLDGQGRYTLPGALNKIALLRAWAAVEGGGLHSGLPVDDPVRVKLLSILEQHRLGPFADEKKRLANVLAPAAFGLAQESVWMELPGSFEDITNRIREKLRMLVVPPSPLFGRGNGYPAQAGPYINLLATFPDRVIFRVEADGISFAENEYLVANWETAGDGEIAVKNVRNISISVAVGEALRQVMKQGGAAMEVGKRNSSIDERALRTAVQLLLSILGADSSDEKEKSE